MFGLIGTAIAALCGLALLLLASLWSSCFSGDSPKPPVATDPLAPGRSCAEPNETKLLRIAKLPDGVRNDVLELLHKELTRLGVRPINLTAYDFEWTDGDAGAPRYTEGLFYYDEPAAPGHWVLKIDIKCKSDALVPHPREVHIALPPDWYDEKKRSGIEPATDGVVPTSLSFVCFEFYS